MIQDQVATEYVSDILFRRLDSVLHQTYDNLREAKEKHYQLQRERDRELLERAKNTDEKKADDLYLQLLEVRAQMQTKDELMEKFEIEYNQMKDNQESYRDQIDMLNNEIEDLKEDLKFARSSLVQNATAEKKEVVQLSDDDESEEMQVMNSEPSMAQSASEASGAMQVMDDSESQASYASEALSDKKDVTVTLDRKTTNKSLNQKYASLRIDEVPETQDGEDGEDDQDDDVFIGKNTYKKQRSPKCIDDHLNAKEDNMIHFKALAKYYGVTANLLKMPECSEKVSNDEKFKVLTPDAHVASLSAT